MDLQSLLLTLSRVSDGRLLETAEQSKVDNLDVVKIPVRHVLPSDKTDKTLRKYAAQWISETHGLLVEHAFIPMANTRWVEGDTPPVAVVGCLQFTCWPQVRRTEMEELLALQKRKRPHDGQKEPRS